ncbi:KAP family P-loop NTPase fold protein [Acinetobacter guerrae]|uniref:KAP family P-loop NTPase fold protein n=1 Tax=Acinetobacter guerrae TaxID=1843371 RepID=UPI00125FB5E8|nr:P-loop NTPase fold protein [Acinetobacter guerrae]
MNRPIKIPKFDHDSIEKPFDGDLWNRAGLAERLQGYIERINVGSTIAIDAEWGAGKTWFVRNLQKKLADEGFKVLYLDAFSQDYIDDPFITISMEIANCLESIKDQDGDKIEQLKDSIGKVYRAVLPSLPMLLWTLTTSLIGAGLVAKPVADIVERLQDDTGDFGKEVVELLNEKLKEHLSAQIDNYENEKSSLNYFKTSLVNITKTLDKPLVFIVDELDRCKPEFAIRLIERIKHFFDIPNVVFVLAVNKKQLEQSINSFYGFTTENSYLEKFIDLTVHLRSKKMDEIHYEHILKRYGEDLGLNLINKTFTTSCKVFKPNARQLVRVINKYVFLNFEMTESQSALLFLVLLFIELNLLNKYNENNFIKTFIEFNNDVYGNEYSYANSQTENQVPLIIFLNRYYSNLSYFFKYISNEWKIPFFAKDSPLKHQYLPKNIVEDDLIQSWYNFIHIVQD